MKEDLAVKGAQGYEHTSTKVASYVSECKKSAVLAQSLEVLNSYWVSAQIKKSLRLKKHLKVHVQSTTS